MGKNAASPDAGPGLSTDAGSPKDKELRLPAGVPGGSKDVGLSGSVADSNTLPHKVYNQVVQPCPTTERIRLVELVEVVKRADEGAVVGATPESIKLKNLATRTAKTDDGSYKQYINIDKDVDGADKRHPEYGRYIDFKARVEWVCSGTKSLLGKKVYWHYKLVPAAGHPGDLKQNEREGFVGTLASVVTETTSDGETMARFYLSQYGGDKFTITAQADVDDRGKPSGTTLRAGTYQVWRKLWYEIDTMKGRDNRYLQADMKGVSQAFKAVYFEWELQGTDNTPANKWNVQPSDLHAFADDYFGAEKSPYQVQIVFVDHIATKSPVPKRFWFEITSPLAFEPQLSWDKVHHYYVFDGGKTWLKRITYKKAGGDSKYLDDSKADLYPTNKEKSRVKIDLSKGPVVPSPQNPIEIDIEYWHAEIQAGDATIIPHSVIPVGYLYDFYSNPKEAKSVGIAATAHELAHLLGLSREIHCPHKTCIMYVPGDSSQTSFCSSCRVDLQRANIAALTTKFAHKKGRNA